MRRYVGMCVYSDHRRRGWRCGQRLRPAHPVLRAVIEGTRIPFILVDIDSILHHRHGFDPYITYTTRCMNVTKNMLRERV